MPEGELQVLNTLLWLLVGYNVVVFLTYALDKWKARRGAWRISEATLLLLAACMGGPGALLGMRLMHHKTRKPLFAWGVGLVTLLQIGLLLWLYVRYTS